MTAININHKTGTIINTEDTVLTLQEKGGVKIGDGTYLDELGKLEFDILERNNHVKEINSKKVRVDIGAIFDEQELEKKQEQHKVLSKTL